MTKIFFFLLVFLVSSCGQPLHQGKAVVVGNNFGIGEGRSLFFFEDSVVKQYHLSDLTICNIGDTIEIDGRDIRLIGKFRKQ